MGHSAENKQIIKELRIMSRRIMLIPIGFDVGLTSVSLGLIHAFIRKGGQATLFKPISQKEDLNSLANKTDETVGSHKLAPNSIPLAEVEEKISDGLYESVLEDIVANFESIDNPNQVTVIEGLIPTLKQTYAGRINRDVARALSADIVFVTTVDNESQEAFEDRLSVNSMRLNKVNMVY